VAQRTLLVHIGGPKTGTTAIQTALAENRDALRRHGILYPGIEINQQLAIYPLIRIAGYENFVSVDPSLWQQMVIDINNWKGHVILSGEALFLSPTEVINEIVENFPSFNVKILITARSGYEIVISHWQESIKAGDTISLKQFTEEIALGPERATLKSLTYWAIAYCGVPIERWSSILGIENIGVQCVDVNQNDATFRDFERIAGIPPKLLGKSSWNPINRSLTYSETELIRTCNEILLNGEDSNHHYSTLEQDIILQILEKAPQVDDPRTRLPKSFYDSISEFVDHEIEQIVNSGVRITGDHRLLSRIPETTGDSRLTNVKVDLAAVSLILKRFTGATRLNSCCGE